MKRFVQSIAVASTLLVSAQADFLLTLTDKAGVEDNICVKSYAFTNNLESIHKQQNQTIDEYSTEETVTNKSWMGKPVYRRVFKDLTGFNVNGKWHTISFANQNDNVHEVVNSEVSINGFHETYTVVYPTSSILYRVHKGGLDYAGNGGQLTYGSKVTVILEYTKTTDTVVTKNSELTTLINYLPSNSTTGDYVVKSLDDVGVRVLKNYSYDSNTDSCIPPVN